MTHFGSRILFVGGSFGGLASIKRFITLFLENKPKKNIELILLDPRAGFINILGIPLAIIDTKFAADSYLNFEDSNIRFSEVESTDKLFTERMLNAKVNLDFPENLRLKFIQGKCTSFINNNSINYQLTSSEEIKQLDFDYCVFSTGRKRPWPFDPEGFTQEQFVKEMGDTDGKIANAKTITVIGGGALGIEIAGEIKVEKPDKHVILIHPHPFLPPETFASKNFKEGLEKQIREVGVDLRLNTRIAKEEDNGDLITTTGEVIKSELNYWCNSHSNNIEPFLPVFQDSVEKKKGEVIVETNMLVKGQKNIFAIGDVCNLPVIKTAGGAYHQGERAANSIYNILIKGEEIYDRVDLKNYPAGMTIVVGRHKGATQRDNIGDGDCVFDDPVMLDYYADYRNKSCKNTFNLN